MIIPILLAAAMPSLALPTFEHRDTRGRFCVDWTETGIHALGWSADADANGRPDAIDSILQAASDAWDRLDSFKLKRPFLDSSAPTCSLRIAMLDLYDPTLTDQRLGLTSQSGTSPTQLLLDNDMSASGTAPTGTATFSGMMMRNIIYHEMTHAFTIPLWYVRDSSASMAAELVAQWFANTRGTMVDGHITTDSGDATRRSLFDRRYRYSNWYWLELLENTYGTSAVLDWIDFRTKASPSLVGIWSEAREDSLLVAWFDRKALPLSKWTGLLADNEAYLLAGIASSAIPLSSSAFKSKRSGLAHSMTLDTRGRPETTIHMPPFSWFSTESPRDWIVQGGQRLLVDPSASKARVLVRTLDYDSITTKWTLEGRTFEPGSAPDTLTPPARTTHRFLSVHAGSDSATVRIASVASSRICRLHVASITAGGKRLPVLDDGDLSTFVEVPNATIMVDFGQPKPFNGMDLGWRVPPWLLNPFQIEYSDDSLTWTSMTIPLSNCYERSWYTDGFSVSAQWVRFRPTLVGTTPLPLSEIAFWGSLVGCMFEPTAISREASRPASLASGFGKAILDAPSAGVLEWRTIEGRLVASVNTAPGRSSLRAPLPGAMLIASWVGPSSRITVRILPER